MKAAQIAGGIALLKEQEGEGAAAAKGDRIVFNMKIWLNHGDEVPLNAAQIQHVPAPIVRDVNGEKLLDRTATLGRREIVAGIEQSLVGMKVGGYRRVRVSPHLAYREKGLPGLIPEHAVLVLELWLREILAV